MPSAVGRKAERPGFIRKIQSDYSAQVNPMAGRVSSGRTYRRRQGALNVVFATSGIILFVVWISARNTPLQKAQPEREIVAEFNTIDIPVPQSPVPVGVAVSEVTFKIIAYPEHQVPQGALRSTKGYEQAVTLVSLPAGLPLFPENLSFAKGSSNPVLDKIPPGMRAMTVRVDATSAVEGWAGSGSVVDVLLIEKDRSSVVAEKVTILSTERSVSPVDGLNAPSVPTTATLLVTQDQCLAINTAQPLGKIAFALRGRSDEQVWNEKSFTSEKLSERQFIVNGREKIAGIASVKEGKNVKSFALTGDRWLPSEGIDSLNSKASFSQTGVK